jgi:hypothetical protein
MSEAVLNQRAADGFHADQPKDFYFALGLAALLVLLHTYAYFTELAGGSAGVGTLNSPTIPYLYLLIDLGLLFNVFGLWLRKPAGILISIVSLSSVGVGYIVWYVYSRQILDLLLSKPFNQIYHLYPEAVPLHPFGLIGATWLNLFVLLMSGVLFIWELKTLRGMKAARP